MKFNKNKINNTGEPRFNGTIGAANISPLYRVYVKSSSMKKIILMQMS